MPIGSSFICPVPSRLERVPCLTGRGRPHSSHSYGVGQRPFEGELVRRSDMGLSDATGPLRVGRRVKPDQLRIMDGGNTLRLGLVEEGRIVEAAAAAAYLDRLAIDECREYVGTIEKPNDLPCEIPAGGAVPGRGNR